MTTTTPTRWTWPPRTARNTRDVITGLLWELHDGGDVEDKSGRALRVLRARLAKRPARYRLPNQPTYLFRTLDEGRYGDCIERLIEGNQVFSIRLLLQEEELPMPRPWPPEEPAEEDEDYEVEYQEEEEPAEEEIGDEDEDQSEEAEAPWASSAATAIEKLLMMQQLATDVILDLAEIAGRQAAGAAMREDGATLHRLSQALDENTRLRRNLGDVTETLRAKTAEVDATRKALKRVQANLDALRTGSQVNEAGFKALDRMMRERPAPNGAR